MLNWIVHRSFILALLFLIMDVQTIKLDELPYHDVFASTPGFFQSTSYFICYLLFWNFLFEISLIIILHFKQNAFYAAEHSFINMVVILGQLVNNILLFKEFNFSFANPYIVTELLITLAEILQLTLGGSLNRKLQSTKLVKGIFILRFLHKNWGRIIYLLTKFQISIYAYYFLKNSWISPIIFIAVLFGLTLTTHITLWIILNVNTTGELEIKNYLIDNSSKGQEYADLLRSIDAGEIDYNQTEVQIADRLSALSDDDRKLDLVTSPTQIAWVIIEDKVFDITGLRHPKGNYILNSIKYRDITREIYGLKSWRFQENNYVKVSQHRHVARTFEFLKKHCIGELSTNNVLISSVRDNVSISGTDSNLNLFDSKIGVQDNPRLNRINFWKVVQTYDFNDELKVHFLAKSEKDHAVNLSAFWLRNFGKYYFIRTDDSSVDCYYNLLSLSPRYITLRKEWYNKLNFPFMKDLENSMSYGLKELAELYPIMQSNLDPKLKNIIEVTDEVRDAYLPVCYYKSNHKQLNLADKEKLRVNGPIGLGLGFEANSTKRILIVIKDEGVLPFTDFFEFLGQRALIELNQQTQPHPLFGKEYLLYYINDMSLWIYWEISEEFWQLAEMLGYLGLATFCKASNHTSPTGETNDTGIMQTVKKINIISNKPSYCERKLSISNGLGNNFEEIREKVLGENKDTIDKVIVSGETSFINRVLKGVDPQSHQIIVL